MAQKGEILQRTDAFDKERERVQHLFKGQETPAEELHRLEWEKFEAQMKAREVRPGGVTHMTTSYFPIMLSTG